MLQEVRFCLTERSLIDCYGLDVVQTIEIKGKDAIRNDNITIKGPLRMQWSLFELRTKELSSR